ncbi:MAG TPA: hypothetical protein VGM31_22765 [Puia sp.]
MNKKKTKPIRNKGEVQESNDERIDQDFPGFPHPPSKKESIGSADAFEETENNRDDADSDEDDDDHYLRNRGALPDEEK